MSKDILKRNMNIFLLSNYFKKGTTENKSLSEMDMRI